MLVAYVDPSKDAAIAEGTMDMAFVNNTDDPVILAGSCSGGQISFTVYGHETRPANRRVTFESRVLSEQEGKGTQLVADPTQPIGYVYQTQSPHTGMSAELWKNIYEDEVLVDSVRINSSFYQAVGTVYSIGVASSNAYFTQSMYKAVGTNSLSYVQSVIQYCQTHGTENTASAGGRSESSAQSGASSQSAVPSEGSSQTVNILQ
jgi:hypothetical protein